MLSCIEEKIEKAKQQGQSSLRPKLGKSPILAGLRQSPPEGATLIPGRPRLSLRSIKESFPASEFVNPSLNLANSFLRQELEPEFSDPVIQDQLPPAKQLLTMNIVSDPKENIIKYR